MKFNRKFTIPIIVTGGVVAFLAAYLILFMDVFQTEREARFLMIMVMLFIVLIIVLAIRVLFERIHEIKEEDDDYRNY